MAEYDLTNLETNYETASAAERAAKQKKAQTSSKLKSAEEYLNSIKIPEAQYDENGIATNSDIIAEMNALKNNAEAKVAQAKTEDTTAAQELAEAQEEAENAETELEEAQAAQEAQETEEPEEGSYEAFEEWTEGIQEDSFEIKDLDKFTEDEIKAKDKDGDGKLSVEEYINAAWVDEQDHKFFFDFNGDGRIEEDEVSDVAMPRVSVLGNSQAVGNHYDKDDDGYLSQEELKTMYEDMDNADGTDDSKVNANGMQKIIETAKQEENKSGTVYGRMLQLENMISEQNHAQQEEDLKIVREYHQVQGITEEEELKKALEEPIKESRPKLK